MEHLKMSKKRKKHVATIRPYTTLSGGLNPQQLLVIDDLFERGLTELEVCQKHGLAMEKLREWSRDPDFTNEVRQRLFTPVSKAWVMLGRSAPQVAARLIELTESEKSETARKACLDILTALPWDQPEPAENDSEESHVPEWFTERTASRLLEVLAEERQLEKSAASQAQQTR